MQSFINSSLLKSLMWCFDRQSITAVISELRVDAEQEREVTQHLKQANDTTHARLQDSGITRVL